MKTVEDFSGKSDVRPVRPLRRPSRVVAGLASAATLALALATISSLSIPAAASAPPALGDVALAPSTANSLLTAAPTWTLSPSPTAGLGSTTAPAPAAIATLAPRNPAKVVSTRTILHGQRVGILVPQRPNGVLVIAAHGHGQTGNSWLAEAREATVRAALLASGYSLAASDAFGNAWGNAKSVAAYVDLYTWAKTHGSFTRVALIGESMGGLASLQLITRLPAVKAWVGIYPVCNLSTMLVRFPDIALAWPGGTKGILSPVNLSKTLGKRMIFFASPYDTIVPKRTNTDLCAARATAAGAKVQVITVKGQHGDVSAFQPTRVVAFLDAATGHTPGT